MERAVAFDAMGTPCARLGLPGERVTLVAAHAWDVLGARQAGLQAIWVNRDGGRWPFEASAAPPVEAASLAEAAAVA